MSVILRVDADNVGLDDATTFQAYVTTKAYVPSGSVQILSHFTEAHMVARAKSATVRMTYIKNFGEESASAAVSTAAAAFESRIIRKFDSTQIADVTHLQIQLGDASAVDSQWSLDMLYLVVMKDGER